MSFNHFLTKSWGVTVDSASDCRVANICMAFMKLLWDITKKCFTVGLISVTISDRYACLTPISGHSMSPTFNPVDSNINGKLLYYNKLNNFDNLLYR